MCSQQRLYELGVSPSPLYRLFKKKTGTNIHELLECSYRQHLSGTSFFTSTTDTFLDSWLSTSSYPFTTWNVTSSHHLDSCHSQLYMCIWKERCTNSRVSAYQVRLEIEQSIAMLLTTRLGSAAEILSNILEPMFH